MTSSPRTTPTDLVAVVAAALERASAVRPRVGGFPYLAESLRAAGVSAYIFDVPSSTVVYLTEQGAVLQPGSLALAGLTLIVPFDEDRLIEAIRVDQRGESSFPEFVEATFQSGVIRYEVDTAARTCTYRGPGEEKYVESYPAVTLPAVDGERR
ncbi:DUF1398 family protein [Subtercola lobariae]|uniref:DUF1398 domain-containing protein n=1 Tax=Subtercola lobariae TaxID=1588641 RepID=A0A917EYK7_9MICO|nr:DUF1398 family protein [Subtercola lobariae]GGF23179.1 DUF1398 domain-containing protein [Subtercola lobariae]